MTKKQKIWFAIFLAMFLVPEVLWGFLNTFFYGAIFKGDGPSNFSLLPIIESNTLNTTISFIEFVGVLGATIIIIAFYRPKNIVLKIVAVTIFLIFLLLISYLLLFSLNFNPQIG